MTTFTGATFDELDWDRDEDGEVPAHGFAFAMLLLLTGLIFIRPAEIVPGLEGLPLYEVVMLVTLLAASPVILRQLSPASLAKRPTTVCVLGLIGAVAASHVVRGDLWTARMEALEFTKVVLYFLLIAGLVDSHRRLNTFLSSIVLFVTVIAALCILQLHEWVDIPSLAPITDWSGPMVDFGEERTRVFRLQASGIFGDPNDFSLVLAGAALVVMHRFLENPSASSRLVMVGVLAILMYAFIETRSRGGLIALMAGVLTMIATRRGVRTAIVLCVLGLPLLLAVGGGRQLNINITEQGDTAQGRILLWREGLALFKGSKLFGVGTGLMAEEAGQVAHNSYVHAFAEMGLFGGTLFVGAIGAAGLVLFRSIKRSPAADEDLPEEEVPVDPIDRTRMCVLAVFACYAAGMVSLSRTYNLPAYMILAVCVAASALHATPQPDRQENGTMGILGRILMMSVGVIVFFDVFVRVFAR